MDRILFSAVGNSDPMNLRNFSDGPIMHIIRNYRPKKVVLFLTKTMCEYHHNQNRYNPMWDNLKKAIGLDFEVEYIERKDVDNPQEFEKLYSDFKSYIDKIHTENPDAEILLNLSSGTPAIKSELYLLSATLDFKLTAIQVKTPLEGTHDTPKEIDTDLFELNEDNNREVNRCTEVSSTNIPFLIKSKSIISLVEDYDYKEALSLAKEIRDFLSPKVIELINFQKMRRELNSREGIKKVVHQKKNELFYIEKTDVNDLYEFFLKLKCDLDRKDYWSFSVAISPLFDVILKKLIKLKYKSAYFSNNSTWIDSKFPPEVDDYIQSRTNERFYSKDLAEIVKILCDDLTLIESIDIILNANQKMRNKIAHSITPINEEVFMKEVGSSPQFVCSKLWELTWLLIKDSVNSENSELFKNAYDNINEKIKMLIVASY